jgi:hypothetical protein
MQIQRYTNCYKELLEPYILVKFLVKKSPNKSADKHYKYLKC